MVFESQLIETTTGLKQIGLFKLVYFKNAFHVTNFDLNVLNLTFPKVDKKLNLTEITSSVHQSFAHKLNLFTSSVHEVAQYAQQQYAHKLNLFTHLSSVFGAFILSIIIGAALYFFCKMKSRCFPERAGKAV